MTSTVWIAGYFPPPTNGGALATQRLADLLAAGRDVRTVDLGGPPGRYVAAKTRLRLQRIRHYLGQRRHLQAALAQAPEAPLLWTSISPSPLGHARDLLTVRPAFGAAQPVYGVVHWGNFDRLFRNSLTAATGRRLVRRLSGLVFLTEALAERCAAWVPPAKRFVIPNTVDRDALCTPEEVAAKQATRTTRRRLRVLYLSNMIPEKGYLDVLAAVRRLHEQGLDLQADFVGGWQAEADREAFGRRVEEGRLQPVVTHHGSVRDRARIKALYLDADVLVLPTYYASEAQPLAIIEALNAGTPVVVTHHSGIPEMVEEGREACFVPPRDPAAIAEAVTALADATRWRKLSTQARRRFETQFSPAVVRQQWEALL